MEAEAKTDAKSETQSEELDSEPAGTGGQSWAEGEDEAQFTYDEAGNAYAYDAEGNCYVYDAEGNVWAYDELGNPYLYQSAPGYFEAEGYEPVGDDTDGGYELTGGGDTTDGGDYEESVPVGPLVHTPPDGEETRKTLPGYAAPEGYAVGYEAARGEWYAYHAESGRVVFGVNRDGNDIDAVKDFRRVQWRARPGPGALGRVNRDRERALEKARMRRLTVKALTATTKRKDLYAELGDEQAETVAVRRMHGLFRRRLARGRMAARARECFEKQYDPTSGFFYYVATAAHFARSGETQWHRPVGLRGPRGPAPLRGGEDLACEEQPEPLATRAEAAAARGEVLSAAEIEAANERRQRAEEEAASSRAPRRVSRPRPTTRRRRATTTTSTCMGRTRRAPAAVAGRGTQSTRCRRSRRRSTACASTRSDRSSRARRATSTTRNGARATSCRHSTATGCATCSWNR